jgi:MFS family permease
VARSPFRGFGQVLQTLQEVAGNRTIVSMLLLSGGASLFIGGGYHTQMPEYAHDLGHGDPGITYSMLLGADAAGALLAGILLEAGGLLRANPRTALILALLWACAITGFAASSSYGLALLLLFAAGFLELAFNAMAQTLVQLNAPPAIRGRIIGLYNMAALGMRAFSGVTIGVVGGLIGIHWSLALSAMAVLTLTFALLAFTVRGSR